MVILSLALAACLAGSSHAAGADRLYAVSFNGSLFPPGTGLVNDTANVTGDVYLYQIDMAGARILSSIRLDEPAYFLVASPSGDRMYLTNGRSKNITVVDPVNQSIAGKFYLNNSIAGIALSPDGLQLYALLPDLREIYAIDAVNGTVGAIIRVNNTPYDLTIAPDGKRIYAVDSRNDSIAVIDVEANRQSAIIH
ncbi:MAG TPA: YncE family protein, partial [Methanocella sp.]